MWNIQLEAVSTTHVFYYYIWDDTDKWCDLQSGLPPKYWPFQFYPQSISHCYNLARAHGSSAVMKISTGEWKKVGCKQNKMSKTWKLSSSSIWCPTATHWRLTFLAHVGLFWCFHNPSNSDMHDRIFNMLMWSCMHILRETKFYSLIQKTCSVSVQNLAAEKSQGRHRA